MSFTLLSAVLQRMVDYDGANSGISSAADDLVKGFTRDLNNYLRPQFPEYANANDIYSRTSDIASKGARLLGGKNSPSTQGMANVARRSQSNALSQNASEEFILELNNAANDLGGDFDENLELLTGVVSTIESLFPARSRQIA